MISSNETAACGAAMAWDLGSLSEDSLTVGLGWEKVRREVRIEGEILGRCWGGERLEGVGQKKEGTKIRSVSMKK